MFTNSSLGIRDPAGNLHPRCSSMRHCHCVSERLRKYRTGQLTTRLGTWVPFEPAPGVPCDSKLLSSAVHSGGAP